MLVYVLLFLILFVLGLCECFEVYISAIFKYIVLICLFLISGLRYGIGEDYWNYVDIFNNPQEYLRLEPSFFLCNLSLGSINLGNQASFLLFSFFTLFFIVSVIRKTHYFYIPLCLYVVSYLYFESMNTVRQAVAMSIFFYSYSFFVSKKYIPFYIFCFLAASFHYSAIIMIFFAYVSRLRLNKYVCVMLLIISFLGGEFIFAYLMQLVEVIMGNSIYSGYLQHMEMRGVQSGILKLFLNLFVMVILLYSDRLIKKKMEYLYYCNMLLWAIIVYNIFVNFYIVLRLYFYLYIFILVVFPAFLFLFTKKSRAIVYIFLMLIYFIPFFKSLDREAYVPYKFNVDIFRKINFSEQNFK